MTYNRKYIRKGYTKPKHPSYHNPADSAGDPKQLYTTPNQQIVRIISKSKFTCSAKIVGNPRRPEDLNMVKVFIIKELIPVKEPAEGNIEIIDITKKDTDLPNSSDTSER